MSEDVKISELVELAETPSSTDIVPIVDVSAGVTKKVTVTNLLASKPDVSDATPANTSSTTTGGPGTSAVASRVDHIHGIGTHTHAGATTGGQLSAASLSDATAIPTANRIPIADASGLVDGWTSPQYWAQCRLDYSEGNLVLSRKDGRWLTINGSNQSIPSAGVSLTSSGATADTTYYIYAYMSSGTMTLEFSTTTHAADATTGMRVKTGDATRTLVGMARTNSSGAWVNNWMYRYVLSYYNRKKVQLFRGIGGTPYTTSSSTKAELSSSLRSYFLCWVDDIVSVFLNAGLSNDTVGGNALLDVAMDDALTVLAETAVVTSTANSVVYKSSANGAPISEGHHYVTFVGATWTSGTVTFKGYQNDFLLVWRG